MSIEEAVEAQKKEPKKIMMDVYTKWCGPCKMMMANTFTNADVIEYLNANYAVKFDAELQILFLSRTMYTATPPMTRIGGDAMGSMNCQGHWV
jgi:thiol-disulfide isomerase/thioredoxin